ncbi:MAG: pyrroline-5-carboxylate reductase [Clostridia bacterium]|nr:pyrroline-5-carboxylate reductase [Clostridia bacterium]
MRIGFIGCGKMGGAILRGINGKVVDKEDISVYELNPSIVESLKNDKIDVVSSLSELCKKVEVILLAIKPQDFSSLLNSLKGNVSNKLIITIAAGVKISAIESALGSVKVARAMPNTAAAIGEASSVLCFNSLCDKGDKDFAEKIFNAIGKVVLIGEDLMDEVIPIGGSFTAFEYYFYKGFLESSLKRGVPYETAKKLLVQSIIGSAKMIENDNRPIDDLIKDVCSKGGTTLAGLQAFEDNNLLKIIDDCAVSCANRSKELGK